MVKERTIFAQKVPYLTRREYGEKIHLILMEVKVLGLDRNTKKMKFIDALDADSVCQNEYCQQTRVLALCFKEKELFNCETDRTTKSEYFGKTPRI